MYPCLNFLVELAYLSIIEMPILVLFVHSINIQKKFCSNFSQGGTIVSQRSHKRESNDTNIIGFTKM